jgi:hypothetical protein
MVAGDQIRRVIDANARALRVSDEAIRRGLVAKFSPRRAGQLDIANIMLFGFSANSRNISGQASSVGRIVEAIA